MEDFWGGGQIFSGIFGFQGDWREDQSSPTEYKRDYKAGRVAVKAKKWDILVYRNSAFILFEN